MSRVGFEPKIPVFDRAKTFCASNSAATVSAINIIKVIKLRFMILVGHVYRMSEMSNA
jgi:hypothetical protein